MSPTEQRPGRRLGTPLSRLRWVAAPRALARTYEGSLSETIIAAFKRPRRPVDALPEILAAYLATNPPRLPASPRGYVSGRMYELKRRGYFIIKD